MSSIEMRRLADVEAIVGVTSLSFILIVRPG